MLLSIIMLTERCLNHGPYHRFFRPRVKMVSGAIIRPARKGVRTLSLVQLGGLIEKSKLLETFQIELGLDLQKDPEMKEPISTLFQGFLILNKMVQSEEVNLKIWATQGLEALSIRA